MKRHLGWRRECDAQIYVMLPVVLLLCAHFSHNRATNIM